MAWQSTAERYMKSFRTTAAVFILNANGVLASDGGSCGQYSFDGPSCQNLMKGRSSGDKNKLIAVRTPEAFHYYTVDGVLQKSDCSKPAHLFRQGQNSFILFDGYTGDDWKVLMLFQDTKLQAVLDLFHESKDRHVIPEVL